MKLKHYTLTYTTVLTQRHVPSEDITLADPFVARQ